MIRRFVLALAASAALVAGFGGSALAAESFGQHVASCAQATLGQRDNSPVVTCACDGTTMTFANFGAIVEHMQTHG